LILRWVDGKRQTENASWGLESSPAMARLSILAWLIDIYQPHMMMMMMMMMTTTTTTTAEKKVLSTHAKIAQETGQRP